MTPHRTSSAPWVRGVVEMLQAEGLPAQVLCAEAGIDPEALQHPQVRVDVDRVSHLWELAVTCTGNTTLGVDRELAARFGNVDVVGYALASSPHLLAGFQHLVRHMAVISDATAFSLEYAPQSARGTQGYWMGIRYQGATRPIPRQRIEFALLTLLRLCCWLTRRDLQPLAVELATPAPLAADEARYRAAFGLLPRFGQEQTRFLLPAADLNTPIPTHNPSLWAMHQQLIETALDQLGQAGMCPRVRNEIARLLPQGEPRREDVAAHLGLTDRTLQRRLQAESASYQQLLDDTRRELARQYLADPRHTLTDIADLLGFMDQSNLFRACRRWFGMPPGQYRTQLHDHAQGGPQQRPVIAA